MSVHFNCINHPIEFPNIKNGKIWKEVYKESKQRLSFTNTTCQQKWTELIYLKHHHGF